LARNFSTISSRGSGSWLPPRKMRLALLHDLSVRSGHAQVPGELVRIGIGRIDHVGDLRGERGDAGIGRHGIGECLEAHVAVQIAYATQYGC
jgi:hypothetical protein